MSVVEIVVSGPREWVEQYADQLLEARLVACAQIWPIHSRYWWKGRIEEADEARAAMHTLHHDANSLIARIQQAHPYETPCILVVSLSQGNASYLRWVHESTYSSISELSD